MIFFCENKSYEMAQKILENEKLELKNNRDLFYARKETLLIYMKKITDSIQKIENTNNPQVLLDLLAELKEILDKMNFLSSNLKELSDQLENISADSNNFSKDIDELNTNINRIRKELNSFFMKSEKFTYKILEYFEFTFKDSDSQIEDLLNVEANSNLNITEISTIDNSNCNTSHNVNEHILEDNNYLIISEQDNKVFLPYAINDLQEQLANSNKHYTSIEELIEKEYILPLDRFKNPVLARFKETYNLMKNKENSSFLEAIEFALELSFNSTLNPAVITACKNQDELDIYLDCLKNNELDKFSIFKIEYKISPVS